jgi:hypothetical protein
MRDSVLIEESQGPIQPFPAPPLPAEALALSGSGQVAPNLLFYPVSDVPEAPARMSDREVVYPLHHLLVPRQTTGKYRDYAPETLEA